MYYVHSAIEIARRYGFEVKMNESMSKHTTFKIGGNAEVFITVNNIEGLIDILQRCRENEVPVFILGKGSNLLVSDDGIDGVVIKLGGKFKDIAMLDDETVYCAAGVSLARLCSYACDKGLSGLEFAWGIPGSVGGAVYMNAGAYGGEMKDVVTSSSYIEKKEKTGSFCIAQMNMGYRHSIYSENGYVITGATFRLHRDSHVEIRNRMDEIMKKRKDKQPVEFPSAGSVFKRPEGYYAGTLIQEAGLMGKSVGGAQVSEKHAGFIINKGEATCRDVLKLIKQVQKTVKEKSGVELECEIKPTGKF